MNTLRKVLLSLVALALVWSSSLSAEPKATAVKAPAPAATDGPSRDPMPIAASIDRIIQERLASTKVPSSPVADDAEFIRRLSLDIRGRIPAIERVVAFLNDSDPNKRAKLIDEFLADPEYGEHFAIIWYHRMVKPDDDNRGVLKDNKLHDWLTEQFNQNPGWDKTVTSILTAKGDRDKNPATTFWLNNVGDAKAGQPEPNKVTGAASRLFMGVRLECTECHNHPFSTLKQTDFWGTAAFFTQTHADHSSKKDVKADETPAIHEGGKEKKMKKGDDHKPAPFGQIEIPFSKGQMAKATFLGGEVPILGGEQIVLRPYFATWLTAAKNPYFARGAVNKMWANFFGRGIVNPIDDMREESPNSHPQLLTMLSEEFAASGFDLKHLIRCICNSKTYQRTSRPLPENKNDDDLYGRMPLKVMSADMLFDSLAVALNHKVADKEGKTNNKMAKKGYGGPREQFRKFFHAEADDDSGVVEDYTHGIPQVLKLLNAKQINDTSATVAKVMKANDTPEKVIEGLYLTALARRPTAAEVKRAQTYLASEKDAAKGYGDVLWALLNTSEFLFNH